MHPFKVFIGLFLLLSIGSRTFAQDYPEQISETLAPETDLTDIFADQEYYRKHPLDLNGPWEELERSGLFDVLQLKYLKEHLELNGNLLSVYELQSIPLFRQETIQQLLPFVFVGKDSWNSLFKTSSQDKQECIVRIKGVWERSKAYQENLYPGNRQQQYLRYSYQNPKGLAFGFTVEQDAGESYRNNGLDFYSGFLSLKGKGILQQVLLGDYRLQFGQGLLFYTGFSAGKNAEPLNLIRISSGVLPYRSATEFGFFRGATASFRYKKWTVQPFVSYKTLDGNINDNKINSIAESGYHRSEQEQASKNTLQEYLAGAHIAYQYRYLYWGNTIYSVQYQSKIPSATLSSDIKQQQKPAWSSDYRYGNSNLYFFGEWANNGFSTAQLHGLYALLDPSILFCSIYRNYPSAVPFRFANAFGESSDVTNESGWYNALSIQWNKHWKYRAFIDLFTHPIESYRCDAPNKGSESFQELRYSPNKASNLYLLYRSKNFLENTSESMPEKSIVPVILNRLRLDYSLQNKTGIRFHSRWEEVMYQKTAEPSKNGRILLQDIGYQFSDWNLSIDLRYVLFNIDDYDARIYISEKDLLYANNLQVLQDRGNRWYVLLRKSFGKHWDIWLKCSRSTYDTRTEIGSGIDAIQGSQQTDWKIQVRLRF